MMKDFLTGRTAIATTKADSNSLGIPSSFPPISGHPDTNAPAPTEDSTPESPAEAEACESAPNVELLHDAEGRISHIIVTCRCGDQTTLECNY
jgi:hypothetical protein